MTDSKQPFKLAYSPRRLLPFILCLGLILAFAIFFSALAVQQHRAFQTNGLDLGNVDQALWNTAQGRFLHFTLMTPVQTRLALHVEPILLLFVPSYWLNLGGPELLLIVQATVVALGAWPLYLVALNNYQRVMKQIQAQHPDRQYLKKSSSPITNYYLLIFPLAYLLLPTLESAVLFDFHAVTMAATFLLFAFWALEQQRNRYFLFFALLAMACKEDMPLVVAMLGLYAGLAQRRWRLAGSTIGLSLIWFVVAFFIIQPRFAAGGNIQLDRYAWLGDDPLAMVQTIITRPGLVVAHLWQQADLPDYLAALFYPTAFLALFSPLTLLPMLPTLAVNLLSSNPFTWRLEDFHYGAPLAPFLFISAIYGIRHIATWIDKRSTYSQTDSEVNVKGSSPPPRSPAPLLVIALTLMLLLFSGVYHFHRGYTPLARPFLWPQVTTHQRQLQEYLRTIPADRAIFTQSNLAPHLSQRRLIYSDFAYFTDPEFPGEPVDDILLDVTSFENIGGLHQYLRQTLLTGGDYRLVAAQDGLLHLQPAEAGLSPASSAHEAESLAPASFYTFAQPNSSPDYQLTVEFGDLIRLRGYSLQFNRQEEIEVTVDLEPLQALTDVQPVLYLLEAGGKPVGATVDVQPTLVWFPPEQWVVGETVRVRFNTLPWHTRETEAYRLALGLISGDDVWNVSQRHKPTIVDSAEFATRLPAGGTLVELARIEQIWNMPTGGPVPRRFTVPGPPQPRQANFGDQIRLLGFAASPARQSAGSDAEPHLSPTLYWQALTRPQRWTRFVQLVGPDGQVYSQNDSAPDHDDYPTHLWQPGEVVLDTISLPLPAEQPLSNFTLHLGLYDPETGQRLSLQTGGDHVEVVPPFFKAR